MEITRRFLAASLALSLLATGAAQAQAEPELPVAVPHKQVKYRATVHFAPGSAVLGAQAKATLDTVADRYAEFSPQMVMAIAHDSKGDGLRLSILRAETVKTYLVQQGIMRNRVYTEGKGRKLPAPDGRHDRVELELVGSQLDDFDD